MLASSAAQARQTIILLCFQRVIVVVTVMQVVGYLFLVFLHLAVELVYQTVDGYIHIAFRAVGEDIMAAHMYGRLSFVPVFLDREDDMSVADFIEMALQTCDLLVDVVTE